MKKAITTLALILGMAIGATAQPAGGGLFQRGETSEYFDRSGGGSPMLPVHSQINDQDANETTLEGGVAAMFALGVLYLTRKRRDD